jgi:cellulose biosynthesis protein BcsQ
MKAFILSKQQNLIDEIQSLEGIDSVHRVINFEDTKPGREDIIIITDDQAEVKDIIQVKNNHNESKMFYVLSIHEDANEAKTIQSMCKSHNIRVILPFRTPKQIALEINQILFSTQKSTSQVVAAMSTMYGVGLTSTLLMLGKQMTEIAQISIGVLGLNGFSPGVNGINYKGKYLDEIWGELDGKKLQANGLKEKMDEISPNLHYLAGNRDYIKVYTYTPEGIAYLIELAKEKFDVVLIDVGHYIDTALAVQGILSSDFLLVQTNQKLQAKENWARLKEQILEREIGLEIENAKNIWMICSMMFNTPDVETHLQLQDDYKLPCMANLPYYNTFYRIEYRKNLLEFNEKKFITEINKVADALIDYYVLPIKEIEKEVQKRKFLWFGRREAIVK